MSLPPGFLEELRTRVSIAQVIGRKVTWDARKTNTAHSDYWAPCPFHQEKTASFHVEDAKGYYYCFGCHAKGDAVSFLRESENLGFIEAVEMLAREAGVEMPARDPAAAARAAANTGLAEALEAAVQFYRLQINSARAAEARAYLDRRGVAPATRERFEIGFAPDSRTALLEHLTGKEFQRETLAEAGLIGTPRDGGSAYDRFRGRIMFPIRDARGRAIAFGARALRDGQEPKYLNSPDTPLFDKSRTLYNIAPARAAARGAGTVIVAEGYMDVIALAQAGFEHALAPLGTAVTEAQLEALWRLASEPVVALDGDAAGMAAAERLIDRALPLLASGKSLRFVLLPAKQDPDDVIRAGGAAAMQALIAGSRPLIDLLWDRETKGAVLDSPERRAALDARLRTHLQKIADPSLRAHYHAEVRSRRATLFASAGTKRPPGRGQRGGRYPRHGSALGHAVPATRASLLAQSAEGLAAEARVRESAILAGCLNHPALAARFEHRLERTAFVCRDLAELRDALLSALGGTLNNEPAPGAICEKITQRIGRDPRETVNAMGQVRANPHLGVAADPDQAALAIEEELTKHAASTGWLAELHEAQLDLAGDADEGVTWRLRQAAEALHSAAMRPLRDDAIDASAESVLSAHLQNLIDRQVWKKPRKS